MKNSGQQRNLMPPIFTFGYREAEEIGREEETVIEVSFVKPQ
jgi:hypothetical protein